MLLPFLFAFNTSGKIALFMAEAVQGVGGLVVMPEDYIP